jgi:hypothetical protein
MKKKAVSQKTDGQKPITLIVTIYPPKKGQRRIVISAAPEGEMPLIFDGLFTDRHALMDRAYAGVLKREPQIVTVKQGKAAKVSADQVDNEAPIPNPSPVETGEGDEAVKLNDISEPENLPAIEGDAMHDDALDSRLRGNDAASASGDDVVEEDTDG